MAATLDELPRSDWDSLVGTSGYYQSYQWLQGQHRSPIAKPRYFLCYADGSPAAASPTYKLTDYQRFPPELTESRRPLLVGGRTGYHNEVLSCSPEALSMLVREIAEYATGIGCDCLIFDHLPTAALRRLDDQYEGSVCLQRAEAVLRNPGATLDSYQQGLGTKRASNIRQEAKKFANAGLKVTTTNLASCVEVAISFLVATMERYGNTIDPDEVRHFLNEQARCVDDQSIVFRCHEPAGEVVGCAIYFTWKETLYFRVSGFDYDRLRGVYEYFNTSYYEPLATMAAHGATAIHLGTGSLDAKSRRGATVHPLWAYRIDLPLKAGKPKQLDPDRDASLRQEILPASASVIEDEWTPLRVLPRLPTSSRTSTALGLEHD